MKKSGGHFSALKKKLEDISIRHVKYDSYIGISSGKNMTVEGCRGIIEYSDSKIRLSLGRQALTVVGSDLYIENMFASVLVINGKILTVEFV
jgi:sporulation protein YqfC